MATRDDNAAGITTRAGTDPARSGPAGTPRGPFRAALGVLTPPSLVLIVGMAGLTWAVQGPHWAAGLAAGITAAFGLWRTNAVITAQWFGPSWRADVGGAGSLAALFSKPAWRRRFYPTLAGHAVAAAVVATAVALSAPLFLVALFLAMSTVGMAPLASMTRITSTIHPLASAVLGLTTLLAGLAAFATGGLLAVPVPLIGVVVALAGLGLYKAGLVSMVESARHHEGRWATIVSIGWGVSFAAAVLAMGWAVRATAPVPGAIGSLVIFLSLTSLAVSWPELDLRPLGRRTVVVVGLLFIVAAVFVNWSGGLADLAAWAFALAVALFGWSIVKRGEGVVLGVVISFIIIWALVDRTDGAFVDPEPGSTRGRIVAFGDSYMSGEGAPRFFEGTNQVGAGRNECRRAPTAYPYLVALELEMGLDFYACSGAMTRDLIGDTAGPGSGSGSAPGPRTAAISGDDGSEGQMPHSDHAAYGARLQIDNLPDDTSSIRVALVSIGGNDVRFSQIASGCLLPGSCDELRELWLGNVENLGPSLRTVYRRVKEELPDVPIIAMPYPLIISEADCDDDQLDPGEHAFIYEFMTVLNEQVRTSAAQEGVHFFEAGMFSFDGRRICEGSRGEAATNFISMAPPGGGFFDRLDPRTWIHNSMHPTPSGHELTAADLSGFVVDVIERAAADPFDANPPPDMTSTFSIRGLRSAGPLPVDPSDLTEGAEMCSFDPPDAFATRVLVFDQVVDTDDGPVARVPAIPIADAVPGQPICLTGADGRWTKVTPSSDPGVARLANGVVFVTGEVPLQGSRQLVLYQAGADVVRLRAIDFCSRLPATCPSSFSRWSSDQLTGTARRVAPAFVMALLGGWLLALPAGTRAGVGSKAWQTASRARGSRVGVTSRGHESGVGGGP